MIARHVHDDPREQDGGGPHAMLEAERVRNYGYLAAIVVTIAIASFLAFGESHAGKPAFFALMGAPTVAIAIVAALRAKRDGILFYKDREGVLKGWMAVRAGDFTRGFVACGALFAAAWAFTHVVIPQHSPREAWLARLYLQIGDPSDLRKQVVPVVAAIIVAAIAEEIVWRGLVTSLLEEVVGSSRAWVLSAVLYAVAHLPTAWVMRDPVAGPNPLIPLAALFAGLLWGGMARRFERLLPGIFSHILFDWTVVMMFRLWGASV
jgi:membrane protease YdiL (CAAX protease family)